MDRAEERRGEAVEMVPAEGRRVRQPRGCGEERPPVRQGTGLRAPARLLCGEQRVHRLPPAPVPAKIRDHLRAGRRLCMVSPRFWGLAALPRLCAWTVYSACIGPTREPRRL